MTIPLTDTEIAPYKQKGFEPLFSDQYRTVEPRHFPDELDRKTIPPVYDRLIDQTKTPLYLLGWRTTNHEVVVRYEDPNDPQPFAEVRIDLRKRWRAHFSGTQHDTYKDLQPEIIHADLRGRYILAILGNYDDDFVRRSLDDEFVRVATEFLGRKEPPKWIRVT